MKITKQTSFFSFLLKRNELGPLVYMVTKNAVRILRIKEIFSPHILISLTNEENRFLLKHTEKTIDLKTLEPRESRIAENLRASAYTSEADPLFFKAQRGEATMQQWLDKVAEIKSRYPE